MKQSILTGIKALENEITLHNDNIEDMNIQMEDVSYQGISKQKLEEYRSNIHQKQKEIAEIEFCINILRSYIITGKGEEQ